MGSIRQQHFMPQPAEAIIPVANKLPPVISARARHMAFPMIDPVAARFFFMAAEYIGYHIVLSIIMFEIFGPVVRKS